MTRAELGREHSDRTSKLKFVLLIYRLASISLFYWSSFGWCTFSALIWLAPGEKNTPVPRLNKGISCHEKGDKNYSFEQGGQALISGGSATGGSKNNLSHHHVAHMTAPHPAEPELQFARTRLACVIVGGNQWHGAHAAAPLLCLPSWWPNNSRRRAAHELEPFYAFVWLTNNKLREVKTLALWPMSTHCNVLLDCLKWACFYTSLDLPTPPMSLSMRWENSCSNVFCRLFVKLYYSWALLWMHAAGSATCWLGDWTFCIFYPQFVVHVNWLSS